MDASASLEAHHESHHDDHGHEHHELGFWRKYIFSTDHKVIGIQYGLCGLIFLFLGFSLMLKDQIGIFHAGLAQAFLGLLVVIAIATTGRWRSLSVSVNQNDLKRIGRIAVFTVIAVYIQLALGATMRHQHRDLSILDFPTANGQWIPDTSPSAIARINAWRDTQGLSDVNAFQIWLQMAHRFGALVVAAGAITVWSALRKSNSRFPLLPTLSNVLLGLVFCQILLGVWTIWSNKAADVATAHVGPGVSQ